MSQASVIQTPIPEVPDVLRGESLWVGILKNQGTSILKADTEKQSSCSESDYKSEPECAEPPRDVWPHRRTAAC